MYGVVALMAERVVKETLRWPISSEMIAVRPSWFLMKMRIIDLKVRMIMSLLKRR